MTAHPNDAQRDYVQDVASGRTCAECGEDDCLDFACVVFKADLVRAAFPAAGKPPPIVGWLALGAASIALYAAVLIALTFLLAALNKATHG